MAKNTFATLGILAVLLLSLGLTSAAASENNFTISIPGAGGSSSNPVVGPTGSLVGFTVNFVNTNADYPQVDLNWSGVDISSGSANNVGDTTFSPTIEVSASGSSHTLNVEVKNSTGDTITTLTKSVYYSTTSTTAADTLCELEGYAERGRLEISDFNIDNQGEGSDDEWQFLDRIEIEVEVENIGSDNIEDVEVKMVILDNRIENGGNDVTNDFDIEDEILTSIGKLKDDDQETVTFVIEELPSDLDDGTYYMYIMTYEDGNEDVNCNSEIESGDFYFTFTVESVDYEDSIVVRGSDFEEQINTQCGEQNLEIKVPVYNLGDDKEEKVLVNLYNPELKIDEYIVIEDLKNGRKEVVSFLINIPSDLTKERYTLDVIVSFDWDDEEDEADPLSYDEENSDATVRLNILGCAQKAPSISANLESSMQVGKNLIVKTTITNNGKAADFLVAPTGFEEWADLVSVTPGKTTIASGKTQEVAITLLPFESGSQTFIIQTVVDGETYNQPVSVRIQEEPGYFSNLGLNNTMLYLIAAIAILLILIFLVLIVRIARRPRKADY